jgi:hypothetical protein
MIGVLGGAVNINSPKRPDVRLVFIKRRTLKKPLSPKMVTAKKVAAEGT